ncbi:predicted protein [Nematostella vectensis]|uniref:Transmembrane protein 19 n=1 Tax=Nematostella vectensis TaxID=45351 RepID=A7RF39_NEMVE|nr:predicted protein [Nematostella vectensis]|eukprot:XP_001642091.1 predicted protein [Nematostella vectensis]
MNAEFILRAGFAFVVSIFISRRGFRSKSLDLSGALAAVLVGFACALSSLCFFSSLLAFFLSSSRLTNFRAEVKRELEDDFKEGGQRNWVQVMCNGGIATLVSLIYVVDKGCGERYIDYAHDFDASLMAMAVLGALACSCGDTWSSEIGTAIKSHTPRLITTLRKVPVGTNGGVTIPGTVASMTGGLFVGLAYYGTLYLTVLMRVKVEVPPQWPIIFIGLVAGFFGSIIDSFLGATVQYSGFCSVKKHVVNRPTATAKHISGIFLLDNHAVNLVSSAVTGFAMPIFGYYVWKYVNHSNHLVVMDS